MAKQKQANPVQVNKEAKSTKVTAVATKERPLDELELKKGDTFLFMKDGNPVYYTRSTANVLFARGEATIESPKGSGYTPPKGSKCKGC